MHVAVAGGTGWIGRLVVEAVRANGDTPIVLARSTGVDLISGAGLDGKLADASVVIDASNLQTTSRKKSIAFFEAATSSLLAAEERAGITHHVALSIVGSDRVGFGYYLGKRRQEELVLSGRVPATVLRATQFHEFAAQLLAHGGLFVLVPKMLSQPIAAREVADILAEISRGKPAGLMPELAGPRQERMPDMVRRLIRARSERRLAIPVALPSATGKAIAGGGLLPVSDGLRGRQTFDQWLTTDGDADPTRAARASQIRPDRA
jgi:uncharacterized protein YbjT (DUF2867 family)